MNLFLFPPGKTGLASQLLLRPRRGIDNYIAQGFVSDTFHGMGHADRGKGGVPGFYRISLARHADDPFSLEDIPAMLHLVRMFLSLITRSHLVDEEGKIFGPRGLSVDENIELSASSGNRKVALHSLGLVHYITLHSSLLKYFPLTLPSPARGIFTPT